MREEREFICYPVRLGILLLVGKYTKTITRKTAKKRRTIHFLVCNTVRCHRRRYHRRRHPPPPNIYHIRLTTQALKCTGRSIDCVTLNNGSAKAVGVHTLGRHGVCQRPLRIANHLSFARLVRRFTRLALCVGM